MVCTEDQKETTADEEMTYAPFTKDTQSTSRLTAAWFKHRQDGGCCETLHCGALGWRLLARAPALLFVDIKSLLYKNYIISNQSWYESDSMLADLEAASGKLTATH